jgi:hypothetical protein
LNTTTTTARNPVELRKVGLQALNAALGHDDAQAFLRLPSGGYGDFTKERHERPERTDDEIFADIVRLEKENADIIAAKNAAWREKMVAAN